ncbi:MAG: hypothetical protein V7767_10920 [Leeuwenhoekiella sp.]
MWRYYLDVTKFNLAFSFLFALFFGAGLGFKGVLYGLFVFGIFGTPIGLIGFNYFHKPEYYMYFNLGFTKSKLIITTWLINLVIAGIMFGLLSLIIALF